LTLDGIREADQYGVWILAGRYADAYLQRVEVQRGYTVVIWRGRHVSEPTELDDAETAGYWAEVLAVVRALITAYKPLKMNYETLGNSLPTCTPTWCPGSARTPTPAIPSRCRWTSPTGESRNRGCWPRPLSCALSRGKQLSPDT